MRVKLLFIITGKKITTWTVFVLTSGRRYSPLGRPRSLDPPTVTGFSSAAVWISLFAIIDAATTGVSRFAAPKRSRDLWDGESSVVCEGEPISMGSSANAFSRNLPVRDGERRGVGREEEEEGKVKAPPQRGVSGFYARPLQDHSPRSPRSSGMLNSDIVSGFSRLSPSFALSRL